MKNQKFVVLNNGGGHNRKRSCILYKRIIATTSALTILFGTSAFLPENTSYLIKEITASAAAQTVTLSKNTSVTLTDSCGKNCQGHIFTQSDSNTELEGVSIAV